MNDRIKELAEQSDLWRMLEEYSWEFGSCDPEKDCGRIEKFAQLIVRECSKLVETRDARSEPGEHIYLLKCFGLLNDNDSTYTN